MDVSESFNYFPEQSPNPVGIFEQVVVYQLPQRALVTELHLRKQHHVTIVTASAGSTIDFVGNVKLGISVAVQFLYFQLLSAIHSDSEARCLSLT